MSLLNLFDWNNAKEETPSSACGSACGASDNPQPKPTACGSACGAGDK